MAEEELFGPEFLIRRPLLEAIESEDVGRAADRRDRPCRRRVRGVPARGALGLPDHDPGDRHVHAKRRPAVVLTSNRTRELHDALKRRCLFHWIGHPSLEREIEIVRLRVPGVGERLATQAATFVQGLRRLDLAKPPGRRRDHRLDARARRPRPGGARRRGRHGDARLGAQVPRGLRVGARRRARPSCCEEARAAR